jgi:phosphate/sulfate permease
METQLPTEKQVARIQSLSRMLGETKTKKLNKRMAIELIFELENKAAMTTVFFILIGIACVILAAWYVRGMRENRD